MHLLRWFAVLLAIGGGAAAASGAPHRRLPKYDHIVVVIMENHSFAQISRPGATVYLRKLASGGAVFDNSHGVAHPSLPNYLALFSGSTQDVRDDARHDFAIPSLAGRLRDGGKTFVGYAEAGSPRKHNPWEAFADAKGVGTSMAGFPRDYARLPSVSFVIPNLHNDMHDGSISQADAWLEKHLGGYADWSMTHNSLLIVTFDEDDFQKANHIFTLLHGAGVKPGHYREPIDHYTVLRTIEDIEAIAPLGISAARKPIASAWSRP